jgi:hypothetical protein
MDTTPEPAAPVTAAEYKRLYRGKLMVLTKPAGDAIAACDFCRILSVETVSPDVWISARFLDDSVRSFRPDKLRLATAEEEASMAAHQNWHDTTG